MAASDPTADVTAVAQRLYRFGTLPLSPARERDLGPDDDSLAVLGLTVGGAARRAVEADYAAHTLTGWYSFTRLPAGGPAAAACKLYISPMPHALVDAFPVIVAQCVRAQVRSFKVGRGIQGLLRPDKVVAYFDDPAHLRAVAGALTRGLRRCPVHGVPFTADLGCDGLLSWGVDPDGGVKGESWRAWITALVAGVLVTTATAPREQRVAEALHAVRRLGIDSDTWQPRTD